MTNIDIKTEYGQYANYDEAAMAACRAIFGPDDVEVDISSLLDGQEANGIDPACRWRLYKALCVGVVSSLRISQYDDGTASDAATRVLWAKRQHPDLVRHNPDCDHVGRRLVRLFEWCAATAKSIIGVQEGKPINGRAYDCDNVSDIESMAHGIAADLISEYPWVYKDPNIEGYDPTVPGKALFRLRLWKQWQKCNSPKYRQPDNRIDIAKVDIPVEAPYNRVDTKIVLWSVVNNLKPEWKGIVDMRFRRDMTIDDIAKETGRKLNKVKETYYKHILPRLRKDLAHAEADLLEDLR